DHIQRLARCHAEAFALAEFELHRILTDASGSPLLRAATGIIEFGVVANIARRLGPDQQVPATGLAYPLTETYAALLHKIVASDADAARALMATLLTDPA
ncbi:MAG: FCD domain-containing protein, partial [Cypionkella sp.]